MTVVVTQYFILIFPLSVAASLVPSCCPRGQILDTDSMACVDGHTGPLDLSDIVDSDTRLDVDNSKIPTCSGENGSLETFSMRKHQNAKLSSEGHLLTSKYGDSKIKDFCVSTTTSQDVVAQLCDPCASGQVRTFV